MAKANGNRGPNQLSVLGLRARAKVPGLHTDGGGLYLRVGSDGRQRSWLAIFHLHGRRREMGLGSLDAVSLARAREKAAEVRAMVADGIDPIEARRQTRAIPTFGVIADDWIKAQSANVRSDKSVARYRRALGKDGYAENLRSKRVDQITGEDVLGILRPLWSEKLTTARSLRTYLHSVLDLAKARRLRAGENPAAWEGLLKAELGKATKAVKEHHAALPWRDMPTFMTDLRGRPAASARALEFLILNASRTSEVLGMRVGEVDFERSIWTVPAVRMKSARMHEVPLAKASVALLRTVIPEGASADAHVFGGDAPLSNMSMAMLMRRMGRGDLTVHGFRSSFRDWAGDATEHPREIAEMALAHVIGNDAELAYRRGNALARRARLMADWASYLDGKLVPIEHGEEEAKPSPVMVEEVQQPAPPKPAKGRGKAYQKRLAREQARIEEAELQTSLL